MLRAQMYIKSHLLNTISNIFFVNPTPKAV
jgi:hypothetical protein